MGCTNSTIDRPQISQYFRFVAPKKFATKVPCRVAIRTARSITEEVPEARHSSVGAFARLHEANSERDTHRMTNKFKLTLPIPLSKGRVGGQVIDFLNMSSWARFLVDKHLWHQLCGLEAPDEDRCVAIWSEFWKRFQAICPGHEVQKNNEAELALCCCMGTRAGQPGKLQYLWYPHTVLWAMASAQLTMPRKTGTTPPWSSTTKIPVGPLVTFSAFCRNPCTMRTMVKRWMLSKIFWDASQQTFVSCLRKESLIEGAFSAWAIGPGLLKQDA